MISRSNRGTMIYIAIILGVLIAFDLLVIITNIYISPHLDGIAAPDIFIYVKVVLTIFPFILAINWINNDKFKLYKQNFYKFIVVIFSITILYATLMYIYKYYLIYDTAIIIRDRILNGNPDLVFDLSGDNYVTLRYITTIFGGFNSEFSLMAQALFLFSAINQTAKLEIVKEAMHRYDLFLFKSKLLPLNILLVLFSFVSMDLISIKYTLIEPIGLAISTIAFIITIPMLISSISIFKTSGHECSKSFFNKNHTLIQYGALINMILFIALIVVNAIISFKIAGTYRLETSIVALIISILIFIQSTRILHFDNK